ncbi:MAG: hypothetical protein Q4G14_05345 [Paracoccus sp. (in: a-proteobacteria)]|nr:hypothetical protein [Paracoccus sp. (in: a-proteobacteria)]MDO5612652.1 hypothetical protein [Paracoccus sp. (in: a-proteobacteria)]
MRLWGHCALPGDDAAFLADRAARIAQELERLTAPLTAARG